VLQLITGRKWFYLLAVFEKNAENCFAENCQKSLKIVIITTTPGQNSSSSSPYLIYGILKLIGVDVSHGDAGLGSNPVDKVDVGVVVDERVLRRLGVRLETGARLPEVGQAVAASTPGTRKSML
jgi:hypothetical protein